MFKIAPMARPKKTIKDLPGGWQDTIMSLMEEGASKVEVKANLRISNDLFDRLIKEEPLFSETVKRGEQLSQAWWERQGRVNLKNREFSPVLWYMNMKNRFGWRDKSEISSDPQNPIPQSIVVIDAGKNPYTTAQN